MFSLKGRLRLAAPQSRCASLIALSEPVQNNPLRTILELNWTPTVLCGILRVNMNLREM